MDVIATCVNRDTWVNPAVIVIFLLTVTTLGVLGFAKNFVSGALSNADAAPLSYSASAPIRHTLIRSLCTLHCAVLCALAAEP